MVSAKKHPHYVTVWYWLLGLALGSVLVSLLPLPHPVIITLIFVAATVKAVLVALYYMHLRYEHLLICALVLVPLLLFALLVLVLLPDIAHR
jgi:cytochrome c oxidase subunit 4